MPSRSAVALTVAIALLLGSLNVAAADGPAPPPFAGWRPAGPEATRATRREPPQPSALGVQDVEAVDRSLRDLFGSEEWRKAAQLLDRRARSESLRGVLVVGRGPGGALLGANEDARRRLLALPAPALAAYVALKALDAKRLAGRSDDAALRERLRALPATKESEQALIQLGERAFERGDLDAAALSWRQARSLSPRFADTLALRLLKIRARTTHDVHGPGALGLARPAAPTDELRLRWARRSPSAANTKGPSLRALTACSERVYFVERNTLYAASRGDGRLVWAARGAGNGDRLLLAQGTLVHGTDDSIRALDRRTGEPRWSLPFATWRDKGVRPSPGDRCAALVSVPQGIVALLALDRRWHLVAVDPWGQPLWHTALFWESEQPSLVPPPILLTQDPKPTGDPCTNPEDVDGECPSHGAFRPGVHLEKERTTHRPVFVGAYRTLLGDGRLAVVGERLFVTADALVAAVGGDAGELIWLRDRMHGLAVGDQGTVRVALHASAYAVEAVTAAGLLVRFDPLDGSSLRTPTARPEAAVYRLAMSPLVLAWRSKTELRLTSGAAAIDLGAPDHAPLWPGATLNGTLVVPTAEGMLLVDTSEPRPTRLLPWPMGPAQVVVREGLLVVSNDKGVAVLEHGPKPPAAPLPTRLTLAHLGDPSWQVRRAAQTALESRLKREGESIRSRLETLAKSGDLEAAAAARGLIRSSRRGGRWATLLPGVAQATIDAALRGGRDAQIAELVAKLVTGPEATRALAAELLDAQEPAHREVLLSLLLHADRRVRGRMVALVRTSPDPAARRAGAELLVGLARRGGPIRPLAILVKQELPNLPGGPAIGAIVARGNAKLWTKATGGRQALSFAALTQWFRQNPGHYPSPDALFAELTPFFESLCR